MRLEPCAPSSAPTIRWAAAAWATAHRTTSRALRPGSGGRVAQVYVELDRRGGQRPDHRRLDLVALPQHQRRHLVLAAGSQARLHAGEALPPPEPEQHARLLSADQKDWAAGEVDEVAPL